MMKWQITRNVKDETPEQRDTKRFAVIKCQSDTQLVVCVCVRVCVFKAHTCGMDRRGRACRYRRSLALRWAGSLRFIHLLRQKGALKTPWAEMHIEPPEPPKKQNKNWRDRKQRPDRLSRGRDSVMATELSMNYETTRQSDGTFQLWKRTVMGK